jgi:translocator protein
VSREPSLWKSVALCEAAGVVPGLLTRDAIENWYATLEKPERTPPDRAFGPVWTALFLLMGVALYRVRRDGRGASGALAVGLFCLQLGLNVLWTLVFFGRRSILGGFVVILALLPAIALTVVAVARVDRRAGLLLVPYLAWVAFATRINYDLWRLNR